MEYSADRIIIAYQAGGEPSFAAGQLKCNLAPASESEKEIFLYNGKKTKWFRVPSVGFVPVFAVISGDFNIKASYDLKGIGNYRFGHREYGYSRYGVDCKGFSFDAIFESTEITSEEVPFSFIGESLENSVSVKAELEIEIVF